MKGGKDFKHRHPYYNHVIVIYYVYNFDWYGNFLLTVHINNLVNSNLQAYSYVALQHAQYSHSMCTYTLCMSVKLCKSNPAVTNRSTSSGALTSTATPHFSNTQAKCRSHLKVRMPAFRGRKNYNDNYADIEM